MEVQEEHLLSEHVVTMAMTDVDNCFHRMRFGEGSPLSEYFGYPPVLARELGITTLNAQPIGPETVLYPLAAALPMGWTWSLYLAQSADSRVVRTTPSLRRFREMNDRSEALVLPRDVGGHYTYVDNVGILSV